MTYDFRCTSCQEVFMKDFPMSKKSHKAKCPKCHSRKTRKIIHRPNIVFKGAGFYAADNRK